MSSSIKFTAKAQEIIDALARIPKHEHRCDKATIDLGKYFDSKTQ